MYLNFKLKVYELNSTKCILNFNQPQTNIVSDWYNHFVKAFRRVPGSKSVLCWLILPEDCGNCLENLGTVCFNINSAR